MKKSFSFFLVAIFVFTTYPHTAGAACPFDSNWSHYVTVTVQSSQVDADLTDFPVYVDLSDLPADFFSTVQADGDDIRVTDSTCNEVPREVVSIDTGANTGELHFEATGTLSSGTNTEFRIYYGNGGASGYAPSATFGAENVWNATYLRVYHLDETSGSAEDSSGTVDGTYNGDLPTATAVKVGDGQDLDGTGDYINAGNDNIDTDFSVSMWINVDSWTTSSCDNVFDHRLDGGNKARIGHFCLAGNDVEFGFKESNSAWNLVTDTTDPTTLTHYVWAVDGATRMDLYKNGSSLDSNTSLTGAYAAGSQTLLIGRLDPAEGTGYPSGLLDEFRVTNTTLASGWVSTEYNNQNSPSTFYAVGAHTANGGGGGGDAVVPQRILYTWF